MNAIFGETYITVMSALGILIAPLWLYLIWLSWRSARRVERPVLFWLCLIAYLGLAIGFAWRGYGRL